MERVLLLCNGACCILLYNGACCVLLFNGVCCVLLCNGACCVFLCRVYIVNKIVKEPGFLGPNSPIDRTVLVFRK